MKWMTTKEETKRWSWRSWVGMMDLRTSITMSSSLDTIQPMAAEIDDGDGDGDGDGGCKL